jgi:hypothetical protein
MENYKELLIALYKEHAPEKVDQIDFYLDRYKGKEKQFYITQKAKYANKKSVTDSKKILAEAMARIKKQGEDAKTKKAETSTEKIAEKPSIKEAVQKEEPQPAKIVEEKPIAIEKKEASLQAEDQKKEILPVEKVIVETKQKEEKLVIEERKEKPKDIPHDKEPAKEPPLKETEPKPKKEEPAVILNPPIKKEEKKEKPAAPIKETVAVEPPLEPKATPQKENNPELSWEEEKKKFQQQKSTYQEKEKRRTPAILYFGMAALIIFIVAVFIWFFHFRDNIHQKQEPLNVQKVKVEVKKVSEESQEKEEQKPVVAEEKETQLDKTLEKKEEPKKAENTQTTSEKTKPKATPTTPKQNKPAQTKPTAERLYNKDINKPAIFVACFAVRQESLAQKKVALLKQYKLDAHYYWIPDIDANGNPFFKVVVGPFSNIRDAYPSLTTAQERVNFDSYILVVD